MSLPIHHQLVSGRQATLSRQASAERLARSATSATPAHRSARPERLANRLVNAIVGALHAERRAPTPTAASRVSPATPTGAGS